MGRDGPTGPAAPGSAHRAGESPETFDGAATSAAGRGAPRLEADNQPATHVPGSPLADREALAVIVSADGVGPIILERLLAVCGSPNAILALARRRDGAEAVRDASRDPDGPGLAMSESAAEALAVAARRVDVILEDLRAAGVVPVGIDDPRFPERLRRIELPPRVLFLQGDVAALSAAASVAVVGTRRPTDGGRRTASRIGAALARAGALVVSGLAVGIDGAAHAAVVAEGRRTVAVIGGGHARLFPRSHDRLAAAIVDVGGAVISEHAPGTMPSKGTFPRRNRIISGLADAVVVVEAGATSGALLTASWAMEQGRECFFVPGGIDAPQSAGCLAWLRDYESVVHIVAGVPQLLEDLGLMASAAFPVPAPRRLLVPPARPVRSPSNSARRVELSPREDRIARGLLDGAATADELVAMTGMPIAAVLAGLTALETAGLAVGGYGRYRVAGFLAIADPGPALPNSTAAPGADEPAA